MNNSEKTKVSLPNDGRIDPRMTESCLFLLIILMEAAITFYLIHGRWIVGGHDGFQYFSVQYGFLNNVMTAGEIPQWSPFMTHGTLATLGYIVPGSMLQNILLLTGGLFKDINFLTLFYAGIFLDELLLLTGVWFLGRRFFASPFTIFFVTLSIMGSCIWILQPWFNFHCYYAIPLILYFLHLFIDSGKWRYFFLAGNLSAFQIIGNLPYFVPVTSLVIFLYFLFYFVFNRQEVRGKIKALTFGLASGISIFFVIVSFALLFAAMKIGTDQIANYNFMRELDWTANLNSFLNYGGQLTWRVWLELFLRMSPHLDITLYTGIMTVPFILLGLLFNLNRRNIHFPMMVVFLSLFGMGTFLSIFFYFCWPMMKYFRHLSLVSPIIKVFLCFMAGFGLDAVFFGKSRLKNPFFMKVSLIIVSGLMIFLSLALWVLSNNHEFLAGLVKSMVPEDLPLFTTLLEDGVMNNMINTATLFALIASVLFASLSFIHRTKYLYPLIIVLLTVHCADIYGFKFSDTKLKAIPLNDEMYKITDYQKTPYAQRRDVSFWDNNPRAELLKYLPVQEPGVFYWSVNAFLFKDELSSQFRTDHWLLPLDHYMRAYWGQPINDLSSKPYGLFQGYSSRLEFPRQNPAALKISGVTEDKIQFFSDAEFLSSDEEVASRITRPDYKGDILFLSQPDKKDPVVKASGSSGTDLSSGRRLSLDYRVTDFDTNNLVIKTDTKNLKTAWLFYSDVWHPLWRANVNGRDTRVYKANLAYKAVQLQPGFNQVHFYFKSRFMSLIHIFFGLNSIVWLAVIFYLSAIVVRNKPEPCRAEK